jgi:hypothetical protein
LLDCPGGDCCSALLDCPGDDCAVLGSAADASGVAMLDCPGGDAGLAL